MGVDKAMLPFGPETMLERIVRLVGQAVGFENLVIVASRGQSLPDLPREVSITHDQHEDRGPLEALRCGLAAREDVELAYVSGCDTPLLEPAWIERLFSLAAEGDAGGHEIVVPQQGEHYYPLSAVYHRRVLPIIEERLAAQELTLNRLFSQCATLEVGTEQLREVDPELHSLLNVNQTSDYQQALRLAGFTSSAME